MMSKKRFQVVHDGMTAAAKKVYQAMPICEMWTTSQIVTEMQRLGSSMDYQIAAGCINSLKTAGLAVEPVRAHFTRAPIRERLAPRTPQEHVAAIVASAAPTTITPPNEMTIANEKPQTPIDILSALSERALQLGDGMKRLAADIDNAALQIEDKMQADSQALQKLKQLQVLLQSLNTPAATV